MMKRLLGTLALAGLLSGSIATIAGAATPAGTVISNAATASYGDGTGATYTAQSNTVTITVQNVTPPRSRQSAPARTSRPISSSTISTR